jgi:hypothetical protein
MPDVKPLSELIKMLKEHPEVAHFNLITAEELDALDPIHFFEKADHGKDNE